MNIFILGIIQFKCYSKRQNGQLKQGEDKTKQLFHDFPTLLHIKIAPCLKWTDFENASQCHSKSCGTYVYWIIKICPFSWIYFFN